MTADDQLVSYLLGSLPDEEIERLDELSVTDEPFAQRLREVEFDLVDAYVRGELAGDLRTRIESVYQSSERGRSRLRCAQALHVLTRQPPVAVPATSRSGDTIERALRSWGLPVAATLVLAVASTWLFNSNARLRRDVQQLESQRDSLSASAEQARRELAARSQNGPSATQPATALFLLRPPRREAGSIPSIELPRAAGEVVLHVELESNDFAAYYGAVKRTADAPILWRSGDVAARSSADGPLVALAIPASLLTPGRYLLVLTGRSRRGADEPLASYPFNVVVK